MWKTSRCVSVCLLACMRSLAGLAKMESDEDTSAGNTGIVGGSACLPRGAGCIVCPRWLLRYRSTSSTIHAWPREIAAYEAIPCRVAYIQHCLDRTAYQGASATARQGGGRGGPISGGDVVCAGRVGWGGTGRARGEA